MSFTSCLFKIIIEDTGCKVFYDNISLLEENLMNNIS